MSRTEKPAIEWNTKDIPRANPQALNPPGPERGLHFGPVQRAQKRDEHMKFSPTHTLKISDSQGARTIEVMAVRDDDRLTHSAEHLAGAALYSQQEWDAAEAASYDLGTDACLYCSGSLVVGEWTLARLGRSEAKPDVEQIEPVRELVMVLHRDAWGAPVSPEEHEALCAAAEAWLTDHEGDGLSILVRPSRAGEVDGLRVLRAGAPDGPDLCRLDDALKDLTNRAWAYALEHDPSAPRREPESAAQ
mgnify:CR=1 FL=1